LPSSFARLGLAGLLFAASAAHAATGPDFDTQLRRAADRFMRANHIPGMAIAITVDGKDRFYNFGVASKETRHKVGSDTLFELGSISKTFTATLATYAQAEGKLSLDRHVEDYLPEFQGKGAGTALLQSLPAWPEHRYRLKCLVNNSRAKAFYLAHGFQVTGRGASTEGDYEELSFIPATTG